MATKARQIGQYHSFAQYPVNEISRSKFIRNNRNSLTMDAGYLIPIWHDIGYPGDTVMLKTSVFARLATQVVPFMDDIYMDVHFWAVPFRLVWEHWQAMNGEQANPGDSTDYLTPQLTTDSTTSEVTEQTIFDYFDIPINIPNLSFNAFNFRAYNLTWNEFYRDQSLQNRVTQATGDSGDDSISDYTLLPRGKRKDYFTSALPTPQKGPGVELPLGLTAPVIGNGMTLGFTNGTDNAGVIFSSAIGSSFASGVYGQNVGPQSSSTTSNFSNLDGLGITSDSTKSGLIADLSNATAATINSLRQAFAIQRMYEKDNIGGTRYREMILAHFGVKTLDARMQIPEFIGGATFDLNMNVVPQTSSSDATSPQGNLAGFSSIQGVSKTITYSCTEHTILFGVASIRPDLTYQQGLPREYSYRSRVDYYLPTLANLGEQAVLNKEIYAQGASVKDAQLNVVDDKVFGYQERWAEMRYKPSKIHGYLRSTSSHTLDFWHLAEKFDSLPTLNSQFIQVTGDPINRALAVKSTEESPVPQFIANFFFKETWIRPLPVYSIPSMSPHF